MKVGEVERLKVEVLLLKGGKYFEKKGSAKGKIIKLR
jgi:hypothetical protein